MTYGGRASRHFRPRSKTFGILLSVTRLFLAILFTAFPVSLAAEESREVIHLNGQSLTLDDVVKIAENRADIAIAPDGMARIEAARNVIQHYVDDKIPAYGINTMYGQDFGVILPEAEIQRINRINLVQEATIIGHGPQAIVPAETVRAAWALMVNSYATGFAGASPELSEEIVKRVNANQIPQDIEYGGSMGDADLTMNAKMALHLYSDPGFAVGAGDATNLLTSNFLTISRAILAAKRFERLMAKAKVSLAFSMEGYRANPSPISPAAMQAATLPSKRKIQKEMAFLLNGSKLWDEDGPRRLQDFLSLRTSADQTAAVETALRRLMGTLSSYCNALQTSPMIDVRGRKILSVTEYDTTQLTLDLDHFRQALGLMAIAINTRSLKVISRPFSDLPSGFATDDPTKFDGLYTRNLTYWQTSFSREALAHSHPVTSMTISFLAEGDEDYSTPFPNSARLTERMVDRLEKIITIEALIGAFALERRLQSGELTEDDIPVALREVHREIIKRSPMQYEENEQYTLEPLLKYFIDEYQPPKDVSQIALAQ